MCVSCNCSDADTGVFTGVGLQRDGWIDETQMLRLSGEFWGITRSSLLAQHRLSTRAPSLSSYGVLWWKTNAPGHRYYLHRGLRTYYRGRDDSVTTEKSRRPAVGFAREYACFLEDEGAYLEALRVANPRRYKRVLFKATESLLLANDRAHAGWALGLLRRGGISAQLLAASLAFPMGVAGGRLLGSLSAFGRSVRQWDQLVGALERS